MGQGPSSAFLTSLMAPIPRELWKTYATQDESKKSNYSPCILHPPGKGWHHLEAPVSHFSRDVTYPTTFTIFFLQVL